MGMLLTPWPRGRHHPPVRQRTVCATDGKEEFWYDRRGRMTRHLIARGTKPFSDTCWKYVKEDGGVRRVEISLEEWRERQRP